MFGMMTVNDLRNQLDLLEDEHGSDIGGMLVILNVLPVMADDDGSNPEHMNFRVPYTNCGIESALVGPLQLPRECVFLQAVQPIEPFLED